jgi:hypothetical protein
MAPSADFAHAFRSTNGAIDGGAMPSFAFAFEYILSPHHGPHPFPHIGLTSRYSIDGVLLRSSSTIPGASTALSYLHENNIPFILLTNGGGKHESTRVVELTKRLGVPLTEENFVQSHTPFKQLVEGTIEMEGLKDKTILVTGGDGDKCRKVAEMYALPS